jgi:hypothetical protein
MSMTALEQLIVQKGDCNKPHEILCGTDCCPLYSTSAPRAHCCVGTELKLELRCKLRYQEALKIYLKDHTKEDLVELLI